MTEPTTSAIVNEQAEDEGLWFKARTAPEAYLQQELRRLHAAIEAEGRQDASALRRIRETFKNAIRALPPMHVTNTDYVPQAKRRPDAVIDRAAALLAIEHAALTVPS